MKLFSFKSLCLRWRGELIDNANVPVGLQEEGEGWRDGGGMVRCVCARGGQTLFKCSAPTLNTVWRELVCAECVGENFNIQKCGRLSASLPTRRTCENETCSAHEHTHMCAVRHAYLCYWQGQTEWCVSRSPKAQGSYRLQLRCVCAPAAPQCVSARVAAPLDGNGSAGSDSVTLP